MNEMPIPGVVVTALEGHRDERGGFVEMFRSAQVPYPMVQGNHSHSRRGVLRGLHFHRLQADLWYVVRGRAQVALADLRTETERPQTMTIELDADRPTSLLIPPGVAHGFAALTDVDLVYWVSREFDGGDEYGIAWDDPTLGIAWHLEGPILSDRDRMNPPLRWEQVPSFT